MVPTPQNLLFLEMYDTNYFEDGPQNFLFLEIYDTNYLEEDKW